MHDAAASRLLASTAPTMSPPDKGRRGPGAADGATHVFRSGGSTSKDTVSSTPSQPTSRKEVVVPPPRAQLTSSSPSPEDQSRKANNGTATPRSRRSSNAHSARSLSTNSTTNPLPFARPSESAILKEKDLRIASLERELSITEAEFRRELDKLSHNESETASFWQARHSALNQQFLRTDTELRLLRDEMRARETETEEVTQGWRDALRAELAGRDEEIRDLRAQVRGLKEWVSTSTRVDGTANTSDDVFVEGMARLGNGLQNWVITNFRRAKIDLAKADGGTLEQLNELVPLYEALAQTSKVYLLQSIVSRVLVQQIFGAYFVGLSTEQEEQLRRTEKMMASFGSIESVNNWRSVTLSILKKEAMSSIQEQTTGILEKVSIAVISILSAITTDNSIGIAPSPEARCQVLRQLISNAIDLSRLMVVQKAVFQVWMPDIVPHQQTMFDHSTMEDVGGEDEESLEQREICCVTFPGIIKRGDENGAQLQFRNVIAKAKILCSPE